MEAYNDIVNIIAMTMGVAWASGINLYAAVLVLGLLGLTGNIVLPENLQVLSEPIVIGAAGLMYFVEFFADKVPGVDTGWDTFHTFIRIPAGALLAAGAVGDVSPAVMVAAGLVGGSIAAGTHATKAGSRIMINTSPEPFSNWFASVGEDVAVFAGLWAALYHPVLFLVLLLCFIALLAWLLPKIWRAIGKLFQGVARLLSGKKADTAVNPPRPEA